jgi:hypothetical protein
VRTRSPAVELTEHLGEPVMVGHRLLVARYGLWVAARQLRRRGDPRRRTRAAVTTVSTVLVALGLYVALLLASLWL